MKALNRHEHSIGHTAHTDGLVMDMGWRYDLMVWVLDTIVLRGAIRNLRRTALDVAGIRAGESVLDVGCGTGILAIEAARRVGSGGRVAGVDPGAKQIARARSNAIRARVSALFDIGTIEHLPFPDGAFDAALSTVMFHHLPDDLKCQGLAELARVMKPGGRLAIIDFRRPETIADGKHFGAGRLGIQDAPDLLCQAGFVNVESGPVAFPRIMGLTGAEWVRGMRTS